MQGTRGSPEKTRLIAGNFSPLRSIGDVASAISDFAKLVKLVRKAQKRALKLCIELKTWCSHCKFGVLVVPLLKFLVVAGANPKTGAPAPS
jgi:hypothetical protein